jgi:hypothetical protein
VGVLEREPEKVVLCFTQVRYMGADGEFLSDERSLAIQEVQSPRSYDRITFADLLRLSPACCPMFVFGLVRANALQRTNLIGGYIMSDLVLAAELRLLGEFVEIPRRLFCQRIYEHQPSRAARNQHRGEAAWFDPANRGHLLFPNLKLILEYQRAVRRLGSGLREKAMAHLAIVGFLFASTARGTHSRVWARWSRLSLRIVRFSERSSIPLKAWFVLSTLRRGGLKRAALATAGPWKAASPTVLGFAAKRLARRRDPRADDLLLDWITGADRDRQVAAAAAMASSVERFRRRLDQRSAGVASSPTFDDVLVSIREIAIPPPPSHRSGPTGGEA